MIKNNVAMPALNQTTYNHNYQQHVPLPPPVSSQPLTQQNVPQQIQPQRSGSAQTPQFAPVSASSRQPVGNMQLDKLHHKYWYNKTPLSQRRRTVHQI